MRSRDGAQLQDQAPMSPDPFPRERLGSGNETTIPISTGHNYSLNTGVEGT